jgi:hypothetical protein
MKAIVITTRVILSVLGIALIVLGVLFWTGHAISLIPLHMLLGGIFVICMWLLSALTLFAHRARGFAVVVFVWGLIVLILGAEQVRLLPGSLHWIVQTVHLLVGVAAIGLGHALAGKILRPAGASQRPAST